jgi:hypothetical protein
LAPGAVGASQLGNEFAMTGGRVTVNPGETQEVQVTCPQGTRLLTGGFEWASRDRNDTAVIGSGPTFTGNSQTTWNVSGRVDSGGASNTLVAEALCLNSSTR